MPDDRPPAFNVIFDPISKSALIHLGDRLIRLAGPFSTYQEALNVARRTVSDRAS